MRARPRAALFCQHASRQTPSSNPSYPPLPSHMQTRTFTARRNKLDGPYDNRVLPVVLSVVMIVALSITFVSSIVSFEQSG